MRHLIEERRRRRGFAAARMAHQRDLVEVDRHAERVFRVSAPVAPKLQVFEQHPTAHRLLLGRIVKQTTVQEVLVDGSEDEAAAGEQLAEILIAGIGEFGHVVVAVDNQHERKRAGPIGNPDGCIQRQLVHVVAPISLPKIPLPALEILEKPRSIDGWCRYGRIVVLGASRVSALCAVVDNAGFEGTGFARIERAKRLGRRRFRLHLHQAFQRTVVGKEDDFADGRGQ